MSYRLGVDVGGTFTDLVLVSPDGVARTCKVLSTTANYAEAIIAGVARADRAGRASRRATSARSSTAPPWPPMALWRTQRVSEM